ncbi:hypothetical protein ACSBR2_017002 [Camellia fascicularis]
MDTVRAFLDEYAPERSVFFRMIDLEMEVDKARRIMAHWMYLESLGCKDFLKNLSSHDDDFILLLCGEAESALATLEPDSVTPISSTSPRTFQLANLSSSIYEIVEDKERVSRGVSYFYEGVCSVIFEDILEERGLRGGNENVEAEKVKEKEKEEEEEEEEEEEDEEEDSHRDSKSEHKLNPFEKEWIEKIKRVFSKGTSKKGGAMVVPSGGDTESSGLGTDAEGGDNPKMEGSGFKLNPNAREWYPPSDGTDEESRCLYITFSNGYPLSENQIYLFFSS